MGNLLSPKKFNCHFFIGKGCALELRVTRVFNHQRFSGIFPCHHRFSFFFRDFYSASACGVVQMHQKKERKKERQKDRKKQRNKETKKQRNRVTEKQRNKDTKKESRQKSE